MKPKIYHLVVRFSDSMFDVGDVVSIHNEIIEKHGSVWFGKLGQSISPKRVDLINKQVESGVETYLYLVKGNRKKSTAYQAKIISVRRSSPEQSHLIPEYYSKKSIFRYMKVFIRIGIINKIDLSEMEGLRAASSIFPITETIERSSSGYFLVHKY